MYSIFMYLLYLFIWRKPASPKKIIWIDPHAILETIEYSSLVKKKLYYLYGIIRNGNWDNKKSNLLSHHKNLFVAFNDHFVYQKPLCNTKYFQLMGLEKRSLEIKAKEYTEKYGALLNEVKMNGFRNSEKFYDSIDDFKISIGATGNILFMTGKHRLAIARLMHPDFKIPARVAFRHKKWQLYRDELYCKLIEGKLGNQDIKDMNHPDLYDLIHEKDLHNK